MTKNYALTCLLICALVLSGCSGSSLDSIVLAHPPGPLGCAVPANFPTAAEIPGHHLELVTVPCALLGAGGETDMQRLDSCGVNNVVSLTTTQDIHVHSIREWMGSGNGATFENGMCLEVITGGVVTQRFRKEWDKHVEEHASDTPFAVDFIIPAGSVVRLSREPHSTIACNDGPNGIPGACVTQEMAELSGD